MSTDQGQLATGFHLDFLGATVGSSPRRLGVAQVGRKHAQRIQLGDLASGKDKQG